jgi:hypothetical protein
MPETTFTVTEDHLTLLRNAYVGWDDMEFGAPGIDPKRPYGSSSPISDIAELLHPEYLELDDDDARDEWRDEHEDRLRTIHRETQTVLQIAISTGEFRAGTYVRRDYSEPWTRAGAA